MGRLVIFYASEFRFRYSPAVRPMRARKSLEK